MLQFFETLNTPNTSENNDIVDMEEDGIIIRPVTPSSAASLFSECEGKEN